MFIVSKRNIVIPGERGRAGASIPKDFAGEIPDCVGENAYFKMLVEDGKILLPEKAEKKSREKAEKTKAPAKKGKKKAEKPEEPEKAQEAEASGELDVPPQPPED